MIAACAMITQAPSGPSSIGYRSARAYSPMDLRTQNAAESAPDLGVNAIRRGVTHTNGIGESLNSTAEQRLHRLTALKPDGFLSAGRIGLEKEALRVTPDGAIAETPHPRGLGSALTHAHITTDFSEALIELITPPFPDVRQTLDFLERLHAFAYAHLDRELLWATSMPCSLRGDESIPIAEYGSSNVGMMKHVYRRGLSHRYGRVMQAISGVHFNYSLPDAFWAPFQEMEADPRPRVEFISDAYFRLIRNFQRLGWMIPYLFGASPAVCRSFLGGATTGFEVLDRGTLYQPHATSLRMSDIGYKNTSQAALSISYDNLDGYVERLTRAIETPHPEFESIGVAVDGQYRQLNSNLLQIENEYYSFVRPKQVAHSGEKPTLALKRRGVQYVEIRALDVSAFDLIGVNESQLRFLEAFLLLCLLTDSPAIGDEELIEINFNQQLVACCGRDPGLKLQRDAGEVPLSEWAGAICTALEPICDTLDHAENEPLYRRALALQRDAIREPDALPSARLLHELRERDESFFDFGLRMSRAHRRSFRDRRLDAPTRRDFEAESARSIRQQSEIEAADTLSFPDYLQRYFEQSTEHFAEVLAPS